MWAPPTGCPSNGALCPQMAAPHPMVYPFEYGHRSRSTVTGYVWGPKVLPCRVGVHLMVTAHERQVRARPEGWGVWWCAV